MNWIKLDPDSLPDTKHGPFLCTNNLSARNAHGRMSHVFVTNMFQRTEEAEGPVTAFAEPSWKKVWNVTHYVVVDPPTEPKP